MLVYVDDVIIADNGTSLVQSLFNSLDKQFVLKGLENLNYFLSFQVHHLHYGFILNQEKYVDNLLH